MYAYIEKGTDPWYFGWSNCNNEVAKILRQHYGRPYFLPKTSENAATDWIFMGGQGLGAHMHVRVRSDVKEETKLSVYIIEALESGEANFFFISLNMVNCKNNYSQIVMLSKVKNQLSLSIICICIRHYTYN